jgi:hypothetical protein
VEELRAADAVVMLTDHADFDLDVVVAHVDFANGAPVPGTDRVIANAVGDWSSLGMFVLPGHSAPPPPG